MCRFGGSCRRRGVTRLCAGYKGFSSLTHQARVGFNSLAVRRAPNDREDGAPLTGRPFFCFAPVRESFSEKESAVSLA